MAKNQLSRAVAALNDLLTIAIGEQMHPNLTDYKFRLFCCKSALVIRYLRDACFPSKSTVELATIADRLGLLCEDALELLLVCEEGDRLREGLGWFPDKQNPAMFYQALLALDIEYDDGSFCVTATKAQRDAAGSYYTPPALADAMVRHAFEASNFAHDSNCACVDFSCGAGDFLLSALADMIAAGVPSDAALGMLWGFDIDPIAVTITVFRIYSAAEIDLNLDNLSLVDGHFHFGNPLLKANGKDGRVDKFHLFAAGLYYSPGMALPDSIFPKGGFDFVFGNPPWEKIRFEERKFLKLYCPNIGAIGNKAARQNLISAFRDADVHGIAKAYDALSRSYSEAKTHIDPLYLEGVAGEVNTYVLFTLLALRRLGHDGRASLILKSAFFTSPINGPLFRKLLEKGQIETIDLFSNAEKLFAIDQRERFAIANFVKTGEHGHVDVSFGNTDARYYASERRRVSASELDLLNPTSSSLPDMASSELYDFVLDTQRRLEPFATVYPTAHFGRLVHLTMHAEWISREKTEDNIPIYEGKFIGQHDLRYSTFDGVSNADRYSSKASARLMGDCEKAHASALARFYIDKKFWEKISARYSQELMLCWRSLTSATNSRTTIAALSPFVPACQSVQFLQLDDVESLVLLGGLFNSKAFDFLVRQKIPGIDLTQKVINQIPVPCRDIYSRNVSLSGFEGTLREEIVRRVISLYKNEPGLTELVNRNIVYRRYEGTRDAAVHELDLLFYDAYAFDKDEIEMIERSFA